MTLVYLIVVAILVALVDHFIGIKDPWRKFIWILLIIAAVIAVLITLGLLPLPLGRI